jgi:hypothetical protein
MGDGVYSTCIRDVYYIMILDGTCVMSNWVTVISRSRSLSHPRTMILPGCFYSPVSLITG